jgi:hypothetical protein
MSTMRHYRSDYILATLCLYFVFQVASARAQWSINGSNIYFNSGNVGIGTTSPENAEGWAKVLDVYGAANAKSIVTTSAIQAGVWANNSTFYGAPAGGMIGTYSSHPLSFITAAGAKMTILAGGNVGIGTSSPSERLHVEGNVVVNGNISAKYQDLAEWVASRHALDSGTVVILDSDIANSVTPSTTAYDTRVAGVVSESPGIVLGESGNGKVKVATVGRVKVKVDATRNPIQIGDLLVTSGIAGIAMKSEPIDVSGIKLHRPGTLIGKALEPLGSGMREITVLLSLQ